MASSLVRNENFGPFFLHMFFDWLAPAAASCGRILLVYVHGFCATFVSPHIQTVVEASEPSGTSCLKANSINMLYPITATPNESIWKTVDRASFESSVAHLSAIRPVPKTREYLADDASIPRKRYPLPFEVERQLADDFAFLAAYESGVDFVSAATVCTTLNEPGLTISLAANEGVANCVEVSFKDILVVLEKCARKGNMATFEGAKEND